MRNFSFCRRLKFSPHFPQFRRDELETKRGKHFFFGFAADLSEFASLDAGAQFEDEFSARFAACVVGGEEERVIKASKETIGRYFNDRLKSVFAGVADNPGVLRNSANCPLYLFCFAAGNERGAPVALRIANSLLKDVR